VHAHDRLAIAMKGRVKLLMQSMARKLAPQRIRVNSVAPGAIQTSISAAAWDTPAALRSLLTLIPYGRIGVPADVGKVVAVWLASDDSDSAHGQTLVVDGGMTLHPRFSHGG
jgi:glucose 1-dehydrogenase